MHTETLISSDIPEFAQCIDAKSHPRYLSLLIVCFKISPEILEFPRIHRHDAGCREVPSENSTQLTTETRVEKIMQSGGSPGLISDIYSLFCLLSVVAKKLYIMTIDLFIVNVNH